MKSKAKEQCHKCYYKVLPNMVTNDEGWCYMFKDRPLETCRQFRNINNPPTNKEALWPTNPDTNAHNQRQFDSFLAEQDKIAVMLELVTRNQELKELKERVRELEDAIEQTLAHRGPDWASILRYALKDK